MASTYFLVVAAVPVVTHDGGVVASGEVECGARFDVDDAEHLVVAEACHRHVGWYGWVEDERGV